MQKHQIWNQLDRDLFCVADACNVYVLRYGDRALAIDFGSGQWLEHLDEIGIRQVEHVVLTHAHRDQCYGLYRMGDHPFAIHVPAGDASLLQPESLDHFWQTYQNNGCPSCYAAPRQPLPKALGDMAPDAEQLLGPARFCGIATPGHTPGALSYIVEWGGRHLAFCGDAVRADSTLHQPYHLEWDHWTAAGALAAWYGLERLGYCYFDWLLPAHGPVVQHQARASVSRTRKRLMDLIRAKGSVCAGEKNRWLDLEPMASDAWQVLPHLYHFGSNSFLLASASGAGLVVDPTLPSIHQLERLRREIGLDRIEVATASHYHLDHSDGLGFVRDRYNTSVWLHPWVAEPIRDRDRYDLPWLPAASIVPDRLLPETGTFRWREYRFAIRPFPGQTRWHCAFDADIDGQRVLFSGDNFQPPTRWNGTGGFCAFNQSRFSSGFAPSAQAVLDLAPDIICNGHSNIYRFAASHYRRIRRWSEQAEKAIRALCPSADWLSDYDHRACRWEPFVSRGEPGQTLELTLVHHNHHHQELNLKAAPVGPPDWDTTPAQRRTRVPAGRSRRVKFAFAIPPGTRKGRHLVAADVDIDGRKLGEVCVALVDIST